jgi:hypothetical protein
MVSGLPEIGSISAQVGYSRLAVASCFKTPRIGINRR